MLPGHSASRVVRWWTACLARVRGSLKLRSVAYYAGSSLFCQCLRFAGVLVSTRLFMPADFGTFAQALLIMGLACLLRDVGITNGLVACAEPEPQYARFHFQTVLVTSVGCGTAVFVMARDCSWLADGIAQSAGWLALLVLLEGLTLTGTTMAQKRFRFRALAWVEVLSVGAWLAVLLLGDRKTPGYWLLLQARLAEVGLRAVLIGALETWRHAGFTMESQVLHYYARFARYGVPQALVENGINHVDGLLLSAFSGVYELGLYERIQQFTRIPLSLSVNLIDKVALASYSRHQGEPSSLRRLLRIFTISTFFAALSVVGILTLILPWFLGRAVGADWAARLSPLWWAATPAMVLRPVVWCLAALFQGVGNVRVLFHFLLFGLLSLLSSELALVPRFGAMGVLLAQGVAHVLLLGYQSLAIRRWLAAQK